MWGQIKDFFHFEMLVVVIPSIFALYYKLHYPWYLCVLFFIGTIVLYSYFKRRFTKKENRRELS